MADRAVAAGVRFADGGVLSLDQPRIMGVLNVTPDSFSDGGQHTDVPTAVAAGLAMARAGASLIDVGGESTRPGAERVSEDEQTARTQPVIRAMHEALRDAKLPTRISIDTTRAAVARAALDAGAAMLNDVSAGLEDAGLFRLAAERCVPVVLMHMRGEPGTMQDAPRYDDVVGEVLAHLIARAAAAEAVGIARDRIVLDPGIGFGKTVEHNLQLLGALHRFTATGYAVMLGTSRKRFIEHVQQRAGLPSVAADHRLAGTLATTAIGVAAGVRLFRVHDVAENLQAAHVAAAIVDASASAGIP